MAKIVIVYRYFWPDTPPYATMLRDITAGLVRAGHQVEIITAQPSYKADIANEQRPWSELLDGVSIRRVRLLNERGRGALKLLNSLLFVVQAFVLLLFSPRRDIYWTATMPPIMQPFLISLCARFKKGKFVYHMQDIYPEIAVVTPGMKINRVLSALMVGVDRYTQQHSDQIIVLSQDMANAIIERGIQPSKIFVSNNFSLIENSHIEAKYLAASPLPNDKVRFIFAGNVGRFQNLESLISAFEALQNDDIELVILGSGRARAELIHQVNERKISNIYLKEHLPVQEAFHYLCQCHVGIVSLSPGIIKYAYPSKVLTYMAANLPVFAFVEGESSLAQILRDKKVGKSASWQEGMKIIVEKLRAMAVMTRKQTVTPAIHRELYSKQFAQQRLLNMVNKLSVDAVARAHKK